MKVPSRSRLPGTLRATAIRRAALAAIVAMVALAGMPGVVRGDGPLVPKPSFPSTYRFNDLILDGDYAYVATDKGLKIFDVSNPELAPIAKGFAFTANCPSEGALSCSPRSPIAKSQGLAKKDTYVYMAASVYGMQVIDVSDVDHPRTVKSAIAPTRGNIYDVTVHPTANVAYSLSFNGELYVWDITNRKVPAFKQSIGIIMWGGGVCDSCVQKMLDGVTTGTAYATGVTMAGNILAAVDWGYGGLYLWDTTVDPPYGPHHPRFLGTHRIKVSIYRAELDMDPTHDPLGRAYMIGAVPPYSGLITVPVQPIIDAGKDGAYCKTFGGGVVPSPAMTAPNCNGVDECNPCGYVQMQTATKSYLAGDGGGVTYTTNGKYAIYLGGRGSGELAIVDLTKTPPADPYTKPPKVVSLAIGMMGLQLAEATGIVARDDYLYLAAGLLGLRVYKYQGLGSSPQ